MSQKQCMRAVAYCDQRYRAAKCQVSLMLIQLQAFSWQTHWRVQHVPLL
jgi:hypothetical protein